MELLVTLALGVGLAASCGFRVFVPLLVMSLAARAGYLDLGAGTAWLAGPGAAWALGAASIVEVAAYLVPWLDNALDAVATPAAVVAGTLATGAVLGGELSPFLRWTLAVIAGGGVAGTVQGSTVLARGASSAATLGVANPLLGLFELGAALLVAGLVILAPFVGLLLVLALLVLILWRRGRRRRAVG